jgi:hypothetical protein
VFRLDLTASKHSVNDAEETAVVSVVVCGMAVHMDFVSRAAHTA